MCLCQVWSPSYANIAGIIRVFVKFDSHSSANIAGAVHVSDKFDPLSGANIVGINHVRVKFDPPMVPIMLESNCIPTNFIVYSAIARILQSN